MSSGSVIDVALALIWREDCLLVTRRPAATHLGGMWEFPGGKCAPGELPAACAEREALEEVGIACRAYRTRAAIVYTYPERTVRLHPVDCRYEAGAPRPLGVTEWAWVIRRDLDRYEFPPANAPLLAELQRDGAPGE